MLGEEFLSCASGALAVRVWYPSVIDFKLGEVDAAMDTHRTRDLRVSNDSESTGPNDPIALFQGRLEGRSSSKLQSP